MNTGSRRELILVRSRKGAVRKLIVTISEYPRGYTSKFTHPEKFLYRTYIKMGEKNRIKTRLALISSLEPTRIRKESTIAVYLIGTVMVVFLTTDTMHR